MRTEINIKEKKDERKGEENYKRRRYCNGILKGEFKM
jgi:hypothetical protein